MAKYSVKTMNTKKIGDDGERRARNYLRLRGYRILKRGYRSSHGEIDIICRRGCQIVFVEVKSRKTEHADAFGSGASAVGKQKRERIIFTAKRYINQYPAICENSDFRFDVIEINRDGKKTYINHIKDAFRIG